MKKILACFLVLTSVFLLHACSSSQVSTALQSVPKVNESATRVMTFNVCYGGVGKTAMRRRAPYLTKDVRLYMPDSIGFQEATSSWIHVLQEALPEYAYVGVGRDNGKAAGEHNPVFYRKDKYDLVDNGTFWLSETPERVSVGWDAAFNRICTWVVLKDKKTGQTYAHYNTHFDNIGKLAQQKSARLLLERVKQSTVPVVVTGDFNTNEHSAVYKTMTGSFLADSKYAAEDTMSSLTYHGYEPEQFWGQTPIDFIYLSKERFHVLKYQVIKDKIDGRFLSDHYAVYTDFVFTA